MSLTLLAILVVVTLTLGYTLYGQLVARQYALDDSRTTPAVQKNDGVDFVPTKRFFLLGQHFSAIAAAGPSAGPILACQLFGWGPCILWIALGVVFIGAVHDFSALVASVRHHARSIAEIVKDNLGWRAWLAIMAFIWIALIYLIIAFADITWAVRLDPGETRARRDGSRDHAAAAGFGIFATDSQNRAVARTAVRNSSRSTGFVMKQFACRP
jgi:carbon starvation protein